jgi:hypothetical protein
MPKKTSGLLVALALTLIVGGIIGGLLGQIGTSAWQLFIQGNSIVQIAILALVVIGIIILIYAAFYTSAFQFGEKQETPQLKNKGFSKITRKLRVSFNPEKRPNALLTGITFLSMGIIMPFAILGIPTPAGVQDVGQYNFGKYSIAVIGIAVGVIGVWMSTNVLLDIYTTQKKTVDERNRTYARLMKDTSILISNLEKLIDNDLKLETVHELRDKVRKICHDYEWYQVKEPITKILKDVIPEKISTDQAIKIYIDIIKTITAHFAKETNELTSKKWRVELEKLYDNQDWRTDTFPEILYLLQEINHYSYDYMIKLIDDSLKESTKKLKFDIYLENINLSALKSANEDDYDKVSTYLLLKLDSAKRSNENIILIEKLSSMRRKAKSI